MTELVLNDIKRTVIISTLVNDEVSSDNELLDYFVKDVGVSEYTAKMYLKNRSKLMGAI